MNWVGWTNAIEKKMWCSGTWVPSSMPVLPKNRWNRWRPTVGLCAQPDFPVDRLELFLMREAHASLAQQVIADIAQVSPTTEVVVHHLLVDDPWDFAAVYGSLHDFARSYPFDTDREDYFVHLSTGTHTAQICMFLLAESRHIPGRLAETGMDKTANEAWRGKLSVIDLDLARYDKLASRFEREHADSATLLKGGIATRNPAFNQLIAEIETVCLRTTAPLLLTGPTGAGKTQLAKRIFELRTRRHQVGGRLVDVNCATLRGDNAMSALFGHKKGAFTGAAARPGGPSARSRRRRALFSTRSASWASMSKPCSCAPLKTSDSCRWARTRKSAAISS